MGSIIDQMRQDAGVQGNGSSSIIDTMRADAQSGTSPNAATPSPSNMGGWGNIGMGALKGAANIGMGALKGAANIGATLVQPLDWAYDKIAGNGQPTLSGLITGQKPQTTNEWRRAQLNDYFSQNADPDSLAFKGGELGSEIAGTGVIGGALAVPVKAAGAAIPALANIAPKIATGLSTGGFSLGSPAASTLPGMVRNAAIRLGTAGTVGGASAGLIDPSAAPAGAAIGAAVPGGSWLLGKAGGALGSAVRGILGATTGAGGNAIGAALDAGRVGDQSFLANLRGAVPMDSVLEDAKTALSNMRQQRSDAYRSGMVQVSNDKSVLDFSPIQQAAQNLSSLGSYKGQVINKNAAGTVQDLVDQVGNWGALDPAQYHTPEGLDALKQSIGDIRDTTQPGTPQRRAADTIYNTVKQQIVNQAPDYAKVMADYQKASDTLNEVTRSLSLGEKATADTALRKFQSIMRNNAQTNYGNRLDMVDTLQNQGGANIVPALAGQALNSWAPRGLVGAGEKGAGIMAAILHPASIPPMLAAAPFASPRLMGEAAYGLGRMQSAGGGLLGSMSPGAIPTTAGGVIAARRYQPLLTTIPALTGAQ